MTPQQTHALMQQLDLGATYDGYLNEVGRIIDDLIIDLNLIPDAEDYERFDDLLTFEPLQGLEFIATNLPFIFLKQVREIYGTDTEARYAPLVAAFVGRSAEAVMRRELT